MFFIMISDRANISINDICGRSSRVSSTVFRNPKIGSNGNSREVCQYIVRFNQ